MLALSAAVGGTRLLAAAGIGDEQVGEHNVTAARGGPGTHRAN